jgi:hypothetical protein
MPTVEHAPEQARRQKTDRVGLLFVHGIGEQSSGSTIVEWGEALSAWLDEWGRGAGLWQRYNGLANPDIEAMLRRVALAHAGSPATLRDAYSFANPLLEIQPLQSAPAPSHRLGNTMGGVCSLSGVSLATETSPFVPAHGELTFRAFDRNGTVAEHRVLMAETHWATVFPVPAFGEFLGWATRHLPLIVQAHLGWGLYQARAGDSKKIGARVARTVEVAGWYALSILLPIFSVIVLALLAIGGVLSFLPLPAARSVAMRLRGVVANVLGDIYILLERPARAAAIRERVRSSYEWLAASCDAIVVIAHSQGAAVALDFLVEERPLKARRLITLGSGARKLAHLRFTRLGSAAYGTVGSAWLATTVPALLGLVVYDLMRRTVPSWLSIAVVVAAVGIYAWTRWRHGSADRLQASREWRRLLQSIELPWNDFSARTDPVSIGAHVVNTPGNTHPPDLRSNEVQNRGSLLSDHTTYWENKSQFVARVASLVATEAGIVLDRLTPFDGGTLSHAWFSHGFRVSYLRLGRTVLWLTFLHTLLGGARYLEIAGARVLQAAARVPGAFVPDWVVSLLSRVLDMNGGPPGRSRLTGLLAFTALAIAGQVLWVRAWSLIDGAAVRRMFRRNADPTRGHITIPPDLFLFGYGLFLVGLISRAFFRYVPLPPLLSIETALAALLLLLNLKDIANCARFAGRSLRNMRPKKRRPKKQRNPPPAPGRP